MFGNLAAHLDQLGTVYGHADDFTVAIRSDLACRLIHLDRSAPTAGDRAELMALRDLMWDPSYVMPEGVQVAIDGVRWQTVPGTFGAPRRHGVIAYRICQVERVTA